MMSVVEFPANVKCHFHQLSIIIVPFWYTICAQKCNIVFQDLIKQLFLETLITITKPSHAAGFLTVEPDLLC